MSKQIRSAAGFIIYRKIEEKIQYLLLQASYENHHWTPPKGHLENGETALDAALRETQEEAGIGVSDLLVDPNFKQVLQYEPDKKDYVKTVTYWAAHLLNPNTPVILSDEHQDFKWLAVEDAKRLAQYPEMQSLFDQCDQYLTKNDQPTC
ncbi:bis(5'-nucleosyl)-tetraphosphatase [asymmetrical] [Adelges cooleyi]|uniref:bis(5'-nucleosyl)-tetraphosphatase [asymmetrical] n=1 Tax=Adelges cooleyi TaxID=133065 RepID=UPI00217F63FA|nr:bis(5'-nucleosyl)-tetraphosphatase [asymmetrical] [Adelges cooleyi]